MRLVLDARSIHEHMGGIGRATWDLARELGAHPRGHHIRVLVGCNLPIDFEIKGVEIVQVGAAMIDEPFEQLHLPVLLERLGADVYLNTTFSIPALKTTRFQLAVIHDVVFEEHPEWVDPGLRSYLSRWSRFAASHADRIITDSDDARRRIQRTYGIEDARITRIYCGLSQSAFMPAAASQMEAALRKYSLRSPYVFYLGSLERKKGIPELLGAFSRLVARGFEGSLVLAGGKGGGGLDFESLLRRMPHGNRVRWIGYIEESEKRPLLQGARAFVYPSLYEGFGIPPLEAMALGIPCVVSNATSLPEVVPDPSMLVDVRDEKAFAGALERAVGDKKFRKKASRKGPPWARSFSWAYSAARYLDLCESLEAA